MKARWANEVIGLTVICISSLSAFADTETVNGITWTYTVSNGEASLGGGSSSSPAVVTSTSGTIMRFTIAAASRA